ncbi:uncharacterized protein C11orf91 homolog [Lagenorhynchus albirostris]|uniref:uncharacterized protein C11orf91 homolog n=1 Tax=Lagenorhynchus albirostris TaxID=27610 RepID=UPI0028E679FD|nr:uncharacterized protein C11orf91 homolog [Lagenorhynchus albirostris]
MKSWFCIVLNTAVKKQRHLFPKGAGILRHQRIRRGTRPPPGGVQHFLSSSPQGPPLQPGLFVELASSGTESQACTAARGHSGLEPRNPAQPSLGPSPPSGRGALPPQPGPCASPPPIPLRPRKSAPPHPRQAEQAERRAGARRRAKVPRTKTPRAGLPTHQLRLWENACASKETSWMDAQLLPKPVRVSLTSASSVSTRAPGICLYI